MGWRRSPAQVHLDRRVHDLVVDGEPVAHPVRREVRVVRHDSERTGVGLLADAPDVQVGDVVLARRALDRRADLVDDGWSISRSSSTLPVSRSRLRAQSATRTAPAMPMTGSSQDQP